MKIYIQDEKLISLIYVLLTGSVGRFNQNTKAKDLDIWDCEEGVRIFSKLLFG